MFFDTQQAHLRARSLQLQDRNAALRDQLADDAQVLRAPLALADQVRQGWRWLKANPQWVGVGVALLVLWRPRRLAWLAGRLWVGWRLLQRLQRWRSSVAPVGLHLLGAVTSRLGARAKNWRSAGRRFQ